MQFAVRTARASVQVHKGRDRFETPAPTGESGQSDSMSLKVGVGAL